MTSDGLYTNKARTFLTPCQCLSIAGILKVVVVRSTMTVGLQVICLAALNVVHTDSDSNGGTGDGSD